ncbi:MAG: GGDEF domain-containing protein [Acidobacteriaceae bacterium]|nr:GGDEF domain-containing protein [Acidobacteriaceae bacterium]
MRKRFANLHLDQPDSDLLNRLFFVQQVCIVLVLQVCLAALAARAWGALQPLLPESLTAMPPFAAGAALLCAVALLLLESGRSRRMVLLGQALLALAAGAAIGAFAVRALIRPNVFASLLGRLAGGATGTPSLVAPAMFFLLATTILLVRSRRPVLSIVSDALACLLCLLMLMLMMDLFFDLFEGDPLGLKILAAPQTIVCLLLLTVVTLLRRAEYGILSFFLGYGIGSRIGRVVLPALFVFPFLLELCRIELQQANVLPTHSLSAVLTACATLLSAVLLFVMASRINRMQTEIQDLTLRDELTGLHNVRGFYLLAEQALLLAKRAQQEFGVLFVDLDNLKQINDTLGHAAGSTMLVETAKLLRSTFRDTDVIGRIGGDEFVVAGQFAQQTIDSAMERLTACARSKAAESTRPFPLAFSMGYAPILGPHESLKQMIMRADQAMYDNKRRKKLLATA